MLPSVYIQYKRLQVFDLKDCKLYIPFMKADEAFAQVQTWFSGQVTAHPVR
jgi:hypothetical protein